VEDLGNKVPVNDEELTLKEVINSLIGNIKYLRSKWLLLVAFTTLGVVLGIAYSLRQKPIYEAVVTFALQDDQNQGSAGAYSGLASQLGMDLNTSAGGPFAGTNIISLLQSRSIIQKTLLSTVQYKGEANTLAEVYIKTNKLREAWKENPQLKSISFTPNADPEHFTLIQDSVLKTFYQNISKNLLTITKVEDATSIISVTIKSTDQLFSKIFAETLVKDVSDFYIETKIKKTVENVAILQNQRDSVRRELDRAIHGVASSSDVNPNPNPNMQVLHVASQRKGFDVQINQSMLSELVRNLELAKVTLRKETPLIQIIDKPVLPLDVKKFSTVKGVVIGGFVGCLLIIMILLIKRYINKVML